MTVEWDEAKSAKTKAERGFGFDSAASVFEDEKRFEAEARATKARSAADIRAFARSPAAKAMSEEMRRHGPEPSEADLREIPELTDEKLAGLYRPVKAPVTVRIDADILAWLKSKDGKYQARLNATLRSAMLAERRAGKSSAR